MSLQESSCGNDAIKECSEHSIWVSDPPVANLELNCAAKLWTHWRCHSRCFGDTTAYIEFFLAGTWPRCFTSSRTGFRVGTVGLSDEAFGAEAGIGFGGHEYLQTFWSSGPKTTTMLPLWFTVRTTRLTG